MKLRGAPTEQLQTLQFMSDGMYVYWVYVLRTQETVTHPVTGERVKEHPVYLHTLELKVKSCVNDSIMLVYACTMFTSVSTYTYSYIDIRCSIIGDLCCMSLWVLYSSVSTAIVTTA